jgi:hypothetical protein
MSIVENKAFNDNWAILCKSLEEDVLNVSKVPKPIEDINLTVLKHLFGMVKV